MTSTSPTPGHKPRILIVDDEPHNRRVLEIILEQEGYLLSAAASGEEALELVKQQMPDLILLDVMMPGMDGYAVARAIKDNVATRKIPIVMVTALDDRHARLLGLTAGAEEFLSKPVDRAELCVRVSNLLRLKAYADQHDAAIQMLDHYSQNLEREVTARTSALAESEERFRQLAEAIDEVFFLIDPQVTQVFYVSPAYERIYGRIPETMYANPRAWIDASHPDDIERLRNEIMPDGVLIPFDIEYKITVAGFAERSIRARGFPIYNDEGGIFRFAGIAEDITERRSLEAQVRQAGKMDAIGRLASGVAHDFNNLLTVILGFAAFLTADSSMGVEQGKDLGEIVKAAHRASNLTKQLLAFSRQQVLNAEALDVNRLMTDMTGMFSRLIGEHIDVRLLLSPTVPLALADRSQYEQVVMNLVVNARDAMEAGGAITIETSEVELENSAFHKELVTRGRYVMLAVTDTGSGMSRETQQRLFEPFFTTKAVGKGTGLGLSTTYGIVKQSRGYIWVYSELGQGTTFKVYFPRAVTAAAEATLATPAQGGKASGTVLLVEDEAGVRQLSKRILHEAGYRVLEAANGNDAEKVFARHSDTIDLVVTDVVMPGCGGPELLNRLKIQSPALKVLYMSGYTELSMAHTAGLDAGLPFVQKPFTAADFVRHVREAMSR